MALEAETVLTWFDKLFQVVIGIGTLGASFTFTVILAPISKTKNPEISPDQVDHYVALSWLFFVLAVASASSFSVSFYFGQNLITKGYNNHWWSTNCLLLLASIIVQGLVLAAFFTSSLAVKAFSKDVGNAAFCLTVVFAFLLFGLVVAQTMYGKTPLVKLKLTSSDYS